MSKDKDINEKNAENTSLISYSIAHGRNEIFHYLYNHGADINIIDKEVGLQYFTLHILKIMRF